MTLARIESETERRRDAAFFFDAHRRLQRILQNAGQIARFLFAEIAGDLRVAAVDRIANDRRGLNDAIEHDREAIALKFLP